MAAAEAAVILVVEEMVAELKEVLRLEAEEVLTDRLEVRMVMVKMDMQLLKNLKLQNQMECGDFLKFMNM
jgi:hypothetical protein